MNNDYRKALLSLYTQPFKFTLSKILKPNR